MCIRDRDAADLLKEIQKQLKRRQWGEVIRLEVEDGIDKRLLKILKKAMNVGEASIYRINGPLDLTFLMKVNGLDGYDHLKYPKYQPQLSKDINLEEDLFTQIRRKDILLFHPFLSLIHIVLYGDSGTGKSTSIKAILNEYYKDGLRMIEIYKHQFKDISNVIAQIKNRNYKYILYMDDLSFEEFEIEYKYLKAIIEGGLETKPDNVVIYATSNRRHLIRETWSDRKQAPDEDVYKRQG